MSVGRWWLLLGGWICVLSGWLYVAATRAAMGAACTETTIGVAIARADSFAVAYLCRGYGQVFAAPDTLIHSITIWRPADDAADGQARCLFITDVRLGADSLVIPDTPTVLLAGPCIVNEFGDGVHPMEYRFTFDPPFVLPHNGNFFFVIQGEEKFSGFRMLAAAGNPYPEGDSWETGPVFDCSIPGYPRHRSTDLDLVFEIAYCATGATPVRQMSWGKLKIMYR